MAVLLLGCFGGCGGGEDGAAQEREASPADTAASTVPAGLDPALGRLSESLRRVGAIADRADCHRLPDLKAGARQVRRRAQALDRFADEQPDAVARAQRLARRAISGVPRVVRACEDQLQLEQAADDLERQADELDQLGEQP